MPLMQLLSATSKLGTIVTAEMISGVLDEVIALLPVILPVSITFIGIRKGLGFLFQALRSA